MNTKYFNHTLDGSDIPLTVGDRHYGQDRMRDFWNAKEYVGIILQSLFDSTANLIIDGCLVTQGAGHTVNVTAGKVITQYQVKPPSSWAAIPPTMANVNVEMVVEVPSLTDQSIVGVTTDGATTNYLKIAYLETAGSSRDRAIKTGSYNSEITPAYTLSADSTPPTAYETTIATFTTNGAAITFLYGETRWARNGVNVKAKSGAYTITMEDDVIEVTGNNTMTLPNFAMAKASGRAKPFHVSNRDGNATTVSGGGTNINGVATQVINVQYNTASFIPGLTEWIRI